MPSGESSALKLFHDLHTITGNPKWGAASDRLTRALSGHLAAAPTTRPMALRAVEEKRNGETAPVQFLPNGSGCAVLTADGLQLYLGDGHGANSRTDEIGKNHVIRRPRTRGLWTVDIEICSDRTCYPRLDLKVYLP